MDQNYHWYLHTILYTHILYKCKRIIPILILLDGKVKIFVVLGKTSKPYDEINSHVLQCYVYKVGRLSPGLLNLYLTLFCNM